ncbi:hypothetical protein OG708_33795 [Streptomyces sp. NBC_01180]|nr:hypothetical protein OG452_01265 [Streptomyces sp. NBC_01197]WSS53835.1 hypothetical protein OG708_33795 [Streptomyces sp. NBC_01180]
MTPGTALLLAAAPAGKGRLTDATSVLATLAAVPPSALTGTAVATVVELADPMDPQTVLTRLRAVAAAPGPLHLYIAGQLQLDRKQRQVHLALARTTAITVRYSGLPWHWLATELAVRPPGATTVVVDLVADSDTWEQLARGGFGLGPGVRLYGRVASPPGRRTTLGPSYLKAMAEIWRTGARPPMDQLHELAADQGGSEGALLFGGGEGVPAAAVSGLVSQHERAHVPQQACPDTTPAPYRPSRTTAPGAAPASAPAPASSAAVVRASAPDPAPDPHPAILSAARAGRHTEAAAAAAAWESEALRAYGPGSAQALHWLEVRADLAHLAGDAGRSCELWLMAAGARLQSGQAVDDAEVEAAVDRAHHEWEQIPDPARVRTLAPDLVGLRRRVPGRQRGALQLLQQRLEQLEIRTPGPAHQS